jgi:hypothetical protein
LLHHVVFWLCANVSEESAASKIRAEMMMEAARSSETFVNTVPHGATTQSIIDIYIVVKTLNLTSDNSWESVKPL